FCLHVSPYILGVVPDFYDDEYEAHLRQFF
ncbi:hypothetical protein Taro_009361, partial [Colocasia esculenta]|nr:hypothetical protein [Colocasia esculenta]